MAPESVFRNFSSKLKLTVLIGQSSFLLAVIDEATVDGFRFVTQLRRASSGPEPSFGSFGFFEDLELISIQNFSKSGFGMEIQK